MIDVGHASDHCFEHPISTIESAVPFTHEDADNLASQWQGHGLPFPCPSGNVRIGFLNVHGLRSHSTTIDSNLEELVHSMNVNDLSILGVSEHQLPVASYRVRQDLHRSSKKFRSKRMSYAHRFDSCLESPVDTQSRQMGGTGLIITQDLVGRIDPKGLNGDRLGRWSAVHLRRANGSPPLTIISVYQVCASPTNIIGNTAWHQQRRALDLDGKHDLHPRQAFVSDLMTYLQLLQQQGHDLIIGGDWNDTLTSSRSSLLRLCSQGNLVDPWTSQFPGYPEIATHERGRTRIDSILISQRLLPLVRRICYTPVGYLFPSDHRGVIVELDAHQLFGALSDMMTASPHRGVQSQDRSAVQTFVERMHAHLLAQDAFRRGQNLHDRASIEDSTAVEALDQLIGEAGDIAEARCTKRRPTWFSLPLAKQRRELSYLKFYRNGLRKGVNRRMVVQRKLLLAGSTIELPESLTAVEQLVTEKQAALKTTASQSLATRQMYLNSSPDESAPNLTKAQSNNRRRISKKELAQQTWTQLAFISQTGTQQLDRLEIPAAWPASETPLEDLSSLEDPKKAENWRTITDPHEIERYLLLRNQLHFGQAQGTPFTVFPLAEELDWGGSTSVADDILEGRYIPSAEISPLCQQVLNRCKATNPLDGLPATVDFDVFCEKISIWRESTTTSPSGRHLGRYKALLSSGADDSPELQGQTFLSKQQQIAKLILQLINFCIQTGYVLERWKNVVNIMIFKDQGNFQIHRLRIIHIYEADFNLVLAVKWRELLHYADRRNSINAGQYGGRPGREATSVALLEELRTDISYCTRRSLLTFDNDAASCYDRIIPALASLINRKYGLHRKVAVVHGRTLQEARYKLKTALGVSAMEYSHCAQFPIYGTGQGSGNSPMVWLFISATLFDVYSDNAYGAFFQDPQGEISVRLTLSGYVDDTNASLNDWLPQHEHDLQVLLKRLQQDAQCWNDLLFISGGKLEISKCSFHVLSFKFQPDGKPFPSKDLPPPIQLRDAINGESIAVSALPPEQPHKILGHLKAPVGNGNHQLRAIIAKANSVSRLIASGPFSRYGAKAVYVAKYIAGLQYVLPQCFFSPTQLKKAQRQSMPPIIAKCGFFRNTSHAILYAPQEFAGGGFRHWTWIQGEGQIMHFLKHWRTNTEISRTLRIALAWCQWQAGTSISILSDVTSPLPHVEARWIPSLRSALRTFRCTFTLDQDFVTPIERGNDAFLMDIAVSSNLFSSQELKKINYCRLYLHVATISELFNASGTSLLPHMRACNRPPWFDPQLITVLQRRPSHYQCRTRWSKFCDYLEKEYTHTLGGWKPFHGARPRRETYFCHYTSNPVLYHWYQGAYWSCVVSSETHGSYEMIESTPWKPHLRSVPVDIKARAIRTIYLPTDCSLSSLCVFSPSTSIPALFSEYILTLPQWEQDLLRHLEWHSSGPFEFLAEVHRLAPSESLLVVSDGSSYERKSMSFGVTLGSSSGTEYIHIMGPAYGQASSHRAECTGCLAGAVLLARIQEFTGNRLPTHVAVTTISDNKGMIDSLIARRRYAEPYPNATLVPDWDLLEEIHNTYARLELSAHKFCWVRGHQDSRSDGTRLSIEAQYNIRADALAGEFHVMVDRTLYPRTPLLPSTKCILKTCEGHIHGKYATSLRRHVSEPFFFEYLRQKHQWTLDICEEVDWQAFRMAARSYDSTDVHLLKLVHDLLPTRHHLAKFQPWTDSTCHFCSEPDTLLHLQLGTCNNCSKQFPSHLLLSVQAYFDRTDAPTEFQQLFSQALRGWLTDDPISTLPTGVHSSQTRIGWQLWTRGFFSIQWKRLFIYSANQERWDTRDINISFDNDEHSGPTTLTDETSIFSDWDVMTSDDSGTITTSSCTTEHIDVARRTVDPTAFIAGLIKTIWTELGLLWTRHLEEIHQTQATTQSPVLLAECQTRIRHLHSLQYRVLQQHQSLYFHQDVEAFLATATLQRLQTYLIHYQPVILASIRAAASRGHQRALPVRQALPSAEEDVGNATTDHHAQEETPHRKRNRLRMLFQVAKWLTSLRRRVSAVQVPAHP